MKEFKIYLAQYLASTTPLHTGPSYYLITFTENLHRVFFFIKDILISLISNDYNRYFSWWGAFSVNPFPQWLCVTALIAKEEVYDYSESQISGCHLHFFNRTPINIITHQQYMHLKLSLTKMGNQ